MRRSTPQEWGNVWQTWDGSIAHRDVWWLIDSRKMRYLKERLPAAGRTLEVGCGSARTSALLATRGYDAVCLDYSPSALAAGRRNFALAAASGHFVLGDAHRLPFRDGAFDAVLSAGLLEHFEHPQPIVDEMARALRSGGLFYSDIVPKKFSLFRSLNFLSFGGSTAASQVFERPFTRREISDLVRRAGCGGDIAVMPMAVLLPQKLFSRRLFRTGRIEYLANRALSPLFGLLDGRRPADWLGFLYLVFGRKDGVGSETGVPEPALPAGSR